MDLSLAGLGASSKTWDAYLYSEMLNKQDPLISGTNIKTINGESILGSGNIEVSSGGSSYDDTEIKANLEQAGKLAYDASILSLRNEQYKVDKIEGKGLSTNDYTDEDKAKVDGLEEDLAKKADNPVVISIQKLGNPVYSDKDSSGWSVQQAENAFGRPYAEIYEAIKKRGVVFGDNNPSLYAFQSMEQDGLLHYCFNASTADSKTKAEYWLTFSETPETVDDIEVAIVLASMVVDLSYDDTEIRQQVTELEEEIGKKQDTIADLDTIRSGAALGATALQEHQDISHLATKEELTSLTNEMITNEEVTAAALNELNERVNEISENVSGGAVTKEEFEEAIKTLSDADVAINEAISEVDEKVSSLETTVADTYATKAELEENVDTINGAIDTLQKEVIDNEEVVAAALNDLDVRVKEVSANVSGETATKVELQTAVESLTNTILENEEISASAFNDINDRLQAIITRLEALENV